MASGLVDGLQGCIQKSGGLCVRSRPTSLAIEALPVPIEFGIDHDSYFGASAPGTRDAALIGLDNDMASSHIQGTRLAQTDAIATEHRVHVIAQTVAGDQQCRSISAVMPRESPAQVFHGSWYRIWGYVNKLHNIFWYRFYDV